MANYGTKEYYEEAVRRTELTYQLLAEAVQAKIKAGTLKFDEVEMIADVARTARTNCEIAKKDLEDFKNGNKLQ